MAINSLQSFSKEQNVIVIDNKNYKCTETHENNYSDLGVTSLTRFSYCQSSDNSIALYIEENSQFLPPSSKALIISPKEIKNVSITGSNSFNRDINTPQLIANSLSNFLLESKSIKIHNNNLYKKAEALAKEELEKIRQKEIEKKSIHDVIVLEGILEGKELKCQRGQNVIPKNNSEWLKAIQKFSCSLYYCKDGNDEFLAELDLNKKIISVESIVDNKLGSTYNFSVVKDINKNEILRPNQPLPPYSPEFVATYSKVLMNQMSKELNLDACQGKDIDSFKLKQQEKIDNKIQEITNIEVVESFEEIYGSLHKTLTPASQCKNDHTINSTDIPIFTNKPNDKKIMSIKEAQEAFSEFKTRKDIPIYFPSGCEARAHIIANDLDSKNFFVEKIFLQAQLLVPENNTDINWGGHVAPLVPVEMEDGSIKRLVFDTALFDKPVPYETWLNKIKIPNKEKLTWTQYPPPHVTSLTKYHRAAVTVSPWNVYWPPAKPATSPEEIAKNLKLAKDTNQNNLLILESLKK